LQVGAAFHAEVDSVTRRSDLLGQRGFANLTWPEQNHARLTFQGVFDELPVPALDHTLHLCHPIEDWKVSYVESMLSRLRLTELTSKPSQMPENGGAKLGHGSGGIVPMRAV
jgi:hypothetical protein